ncbi:MAG: NAD-dependent epimerase/dehydratase family protein [Pseudomonadota bacterium]
MVEKAIIFGGAGFIGGHLARRLRARGAEVAVADNARRVRPVSGVSYFDVDVRRPIAGLKADPDTVVYNLAAVHRTPGHPSHEYYDVNVEGARNVAAFAADAGVRRLVFTSSIAVYGPGEERMDEASNPLPASSYGWSKLLAERVLEDWRRAEDGRRLVIARPAVIFGPGEGGNFTRLAAALKRRLFAYPGRRDTIKGCAYVKDLLDSFDFALARGEPELLYNFAYPEPYTIEAICEAFHEVGGLPRPLAMAPAWALKAAALPLEALGLEANRARIAKLTKSTHIAPLRLTELGYTFKTELRDALSDWRSEAGSFN